MKKLLFTIVLSIAFSGVYNYAHADITSNLYDHWACDEGTGTTCANSGSHGTTVKEELRGTPAAAWTTGFIGTGAISFTPNAFMSTSNFGQSAPGTPFTISAWVNPSAGMTSFNRIMETAFNTDYYLGLNTNATQYQCIIKDPTASAWAVGGTVTVGTWVLVTCTYDGTNGTLYVNNVQVAQHTFSDPGAVSSTVVIGANTSANGSFWKGSIDDIRIYQRVLTASDVTELYHLGYPAASGPTNIFTVLLGRIFKIKLGQIFKVL